MPAWVEDLAHRVAYLGDGGTFRRWEFVGSLDHPKNTQHREYGTLVSFLCASRLDTAVYPYVGSCQPVFPAPEVQSNEATHTWFKISRIMNPRSLLSFINWLRPECGYYIIVTKGTLICTPTSALYLSFWKVTVAHCALWSYRYCLCLPSEFFHDLYKPVFALDPLFLNARGGFRFPSWSLPYRLTITESQTLPPCCSQRKIMPQFFIKPELTTSFPREYNMPSF